jgi:hypothetical protein
MKFHAVAHRHLNPAAHVVETGVRWFELRRRFVLGNDYLAEK